MEKLVSETGAELELFPVESKSVPTVIICPGGGYQWLSDREKEPVAAAFNRQGFHAAILNYHVNKENLGFQPMYDLAWAVSCIRNAGGINADKKKVFVCGFSAGGHVAAELGVYWDNRELFESGNREEHRPDGLILCYPVITGGEFAHKDSFKMLSLDESTWSDFSLEKHTNKNVPPAFIWHTVSDNDVPVQNSLLFVEALLRCNVSLELHLFPKGVHGLSLATKEVEEPSKNRFADEHVAGWLDLCAEWIKRS